MNIQLENVSEQLKNYCENLAYNGLNLITQESIREIEFFLQNASQLEAFRLAISLRYLHVELKRFLESNPAFSIERYVFFLSNCWLQCRAFISFTQSKKNDSNFFKNLMGKSSETTVIRRFILRLAGVEKVLLEGTMVGLVFYFMSLYGKTRGSILKWNLMFPYRTDLNPDVMFQLSLPNSVPPCTVEKIIFNCFETENIPCAMKEGNIFLDKNPDSKIFIEENSDDFFSISKLEKFYLDSEEIYNKLMKEEVTPFDLPTIFFDYLYIKRVEVVDCYKEGEKEGRIPVYVYIIDHEKKYPLFIRIPDKKINQTLITKLNEFLKKSLKIEGIFSKLIIERGQLSLFPLSFVDNNQLKFPAISSVHTPDNKDFLKQVYKIKK